MAEDIQKKVEQLKRELGPKYSSEKGKVIMYTKGGGAKVVAGRGSTNLEIREG